MPILQIRNLEESIYRLLRRRARRQRRSLAREAAVILEDALVPRGGRLRREALLDEIARGGGEPWPEDLPRPENLIREDRDR